MSDIKEYFDVDNGQEEWTHNDTREAIQSAIDSGSGAEDITEVYLGVGALLSAATIRTDWAGMITDALDEGAYEKAGMVTEGHLKGLDTKGLNSELIKCIDKFLAGTAMAETYSIEKTVKLDVEITDINECEYILSYKGVVIEQSPEGYNIQGFKTRSDGVMRCIEAIDLYDEDPLIEG